MDTHPLIRWVLIIVVAAALIVLLAEARGDPGDDGRWPDREDFVDAALGDEAGAAPAGLA